MQTSISVRRDAFSCYFSHEIPFVWDYVKDLIQRALDEGSDYTLDEIFKGLRSQEMQLWVWQPNEIKAVLVTTIQNNNGRWCLLLACAGEEMDQWKGFLPHIETWAREKGCDEMRIYGRRGWAKVLGYGIDFTRMSKDLWKDP